MRLHGQSIKTRVEASRRGSTIIKKLVYTDNPLKQGLKHYTNRLVFALQSVYTDNPLKQGLKHDGINLVVRRVKSTRTIH